MKDIPITQALKSKIFDKVVISTDLLDIANESKIYESILSRSKELADDNYKSTCNYRCIVKDMNLLQKFSYIVDLDGDHLKRCE